MVRTSLTHALLFIAAISVSTILVGVVVTEAGLYAQSAAGETGREAATIDAEIDLINDAETGVYNQSTGQVTLYVKNVGAGPLEPADAEVLLDGEYVRPSETTVRGGGDGSDRWRVGSVLEVTIDAGALESGSHRTVVDVDGARDRLSFAVE